MSDKSKEYFRGERCAVYILGTKQKRKLYLWKQILVHSKWVINFTLWRFLFFPSVTLAQSPNVKYMITIFNKRPMGHIAHLRKQFKSLNKYDYIITLIQKIKKKLYENWSVLHLNKLKSLSPKDALCQVWLKLAQWFWTRRFLNFVNVFSLFV